MKTGRLKATLTLTTDEVAQLHSLITARSIPHSLGTRARMIMLSHEGLSNGAIAEKLGVTKATVGKWRHRFIHDRLAGLHDELRLGRPRSRADEAIAALITKTLRTTPTASPHWSCRTMAEAPGFPNPWPSHLTGLCAPASSTAYL
ncbi:MAG: ISRSO5-transposase protein [Nitrospira sp.]|jgi:putative transposase|nr:ISRSO5-transposase protein [Nitrospira sp.]